MSPKLLKGGTYEDERGVLRFVNDFNLDSCVRFYTIQHPSTETVRAWQGHESESKWFFVMEGRFVVAWVKIDDFDHPSEDLIAEYTVLDAQQPEVLHIPPGHANGLRALQPHSKIAVFADVEVAQSVDSKRRYPPHQWFDWFQDFNPASKKEEKP